MQKIHVGDIVQMVNPIIAGDPTYLHYGKVLRIYNETSKLFGFTLSEKVYIVDILGSIRLSWFETEVTKVL